MKSAKDLFHRLPVRPDLSEKGPCRTKSRQARMTARILLGIVLFASASAAETQPGPNGHKLIAVPAGAYQLGDPGHKLNKPHVFKTKGFLVSDAETTNEQFAAFVQATGYKTFAERAGWSLIGGEGSAEWEWKRMRSEERRVGKEC